MIWSIAWRNVWRNKVRSLIVLSAVAVGLFASVFIAAFYYGMGDMRIKTAIKTEISHIQLHENGYRTDFDPLLYLENAGQMVENIDKINGVEGSSKRLISDCIINTAHGTRGVRVIGVDPQNESKVTDIAVRLLEGNYLEKKSPKSNPILIGQKIADKLKLKLKSKVTIDLVDQSGNVTSKLYKVCGIYKTSNTTYDENTMFVQYSDLLEQTGLPEGSAQEIAIYLKPEVNIYNFTSQLKKEYPGIEVATWRDISKELALMTDSMSQYMYFFVLIIMLALFFGIVNTMLMAVLERTRELGMLMAIGMKKSKVFMMIILESVFLSLSGGMAGIIIGYIVVKIFEHRPIVLEVFREFEMYGYSPVVYTRIPASQLVGTALLVVVLGIVSAVYPARKATRLNPVESIRKV